MPISIKIRKSKSPKKKWEVEIETPDRKKTIKFGSKNMSDYTKHGDPKRKMRYILRHYPNEDWEDPYTAGFWSKHMLWSKPDLQDAIKFAYGKAMNILRKTH